MRSFGWCGRARHPPRQSLAHPSVAFRAEKRLYPIYFDYPFEEIDDVKLHVPAEYKIETVPPESEVKQAEPAEPGMLSYEISATPQGDAVGVKRMFILGGSLFPVASYPSLQKFFNTVEADGQAQIVLQGTESTRNN